MKANKTLYYKLLLRFERVCKQASSGGAIKRLAKPLAFWACLDDRRLPMVLLNRPVRDLLSTPFDDLCATPGVGEKKLAMLVVLLERALLRPREDQDAHEERKKSESSIPGGEGFDPGMVSESAWGVWRANVRRSGLSSAALGRYAASLQQLPRPLWETPLAAYADRTIAEMRALKTHGEKRVRAVIEVFGALQSMLGDSQGSSHLAIRVVPKVVQEVEGWIAEVLRRTDSPDDEEVRRFFVAPWLEQIRVDASETIAELAADRLGLGGDETSILQAANRLGLTRARVYQLLADAAAIVRTRWPEGASQMADLRRRLEERNGQGAPPLLDAAMELLLPQPRGHAPVDSNGAVDLRLAPQPGVVELAGG